MLSGRKQYLGPQDYQPETTSLLINGVDGTWKDHSLESGLGVVAGTAMGLVAGDFNADSAVDLFVANDEMQNFLFINDGQGNFRESGFVWGVAVDSDGKVNGNMGVDAADADNDGFADLLVTSFEREWVTLYRGTEHGVFLDITRSCGLSGDTAPHVTWGCCWGDLDNDGDRDAFIASGHLDERDNNRFYRVANLVYENDWMARRRLSFRNVSQLCGEVDNIQECSRGAAVEDLDNDGDLDVLVLNRAAPPSLLENTSPGKRWLQLRLIGRSSNRDAVGARVRLSTMDGGLQLYEEVRSGRGYQSHWGDRLHFGLGDDADQVDIDITWPDGSQQRIAGVELNQRLTIIQ